MTKCIECGVAMIGWASRREKCRRCLEVEIVALREALAQCVRRLDTLNTGGPDEPDPTVVKARALLSKPHPDKP